MESKRNPYRVLGGQTLIYGLGNVIPRILNYVILTVYYTRRFTPSEYGVITELYAYVAVLLVVLTLGLETGLFRYSIKTETANMAFSTALTTVFFAGFFFFVVTSVFSAEISESMGYPDSPEYMIYLAGIIALDALGSIVFARLRIENRVRLFALFKISNVFITVMLVFIFLEFLPRFGFFTRLRFYENTYKQIGVGFVLISNLMASFIQVMFMGRLLLRNIGRYSWSMFREMLFYSLPLMIAGLAGMFNEAIDRILLRHFLPSSKDPLFELGIYGANIRIAVLMTLFVQMFRYAAEPFFFGRSRDGDVKELYANVLKYFSIFVFSLFLFIYGTLDLFKHFISSEYYEGLYIVPVVLASNVILGLLFNVNMWYKLTDRTVYGLLITVMGALVTVSLNVLFIPSYGYFASAWIHLISNGIMLIATYLLGQRFYPIPYDLKRLLLYIGLAGAGFVLNRVLHTDNEGLNVLTGLLIAAAYMYFCNWKEKLLKIFLTHD